MKKKAQEPFGVKEIARRANVSIGTVDRVIHNREGVSEKTREKINEIIKEMNYQPNVLASRLASKKVFEIAVLIPHISKETDFWEGPLKGIQRAEAEIKRYGISVTTYFFDLKDRESFIKQAKKVIAKKPNGVLLSPLFNEEASGFANACKAKDISVVVIDTPLSDQQGLCYIGPDMYHSAYQAAHLIDFGTANKSKILFLNISEAEMDSQVEKGFKDYFKDNNKKADITTLSIRQTNARSVEKQLSTLFAEQKEIKSIFVTNSRVSAVAAFLVKSGIEDVLLIGYDILKENVKYLESGTIDFLISHKPEEQGYRAIMTLYQTLVMGADIESLTFMPIDIITRYNYTFYTN
ncbi:LacI family DNA-binding transcriptional regulator [Flavisolibacter tropicus]|uniref:Transcriptional regulator n=1 Tax=Flavisolibacter tropicus TaxID=1492898 RepID=A0A172TXI2_9BACT|nr:substrate-binding domain-containing protein [Flavisolibacter tropicus]ANE51483.1 transcriptional regulator [Flavisolibacter tropicus]